MLKQLEDMTVDDDDDGWENILAFKPFVDAIGAFPELGKGTDRGKKFYKIASSTFLTV